MLLVTEQYLIGNTTIVPTKSVKSQLNIDLNASKGVHLIYVSLGKMAAILADDTFKWIFLNENVIISIKISLKFIPKGPVNNIQALVQIMAWRRQAISWTNDG